MFVVFFFFNLLLGLPTSKSLSYFWNFGSLLFLIYLLQVFSGVFLVFFFSNDAASSFSSVQYIMTDVTGGWVFRLIHFNGASFFFFFVFLHFFKALFFFSYRLVFVWVTGLLVFFLLMAVAFMGYVVVWAQMSFWACVVITSLLTVLPFLGPKLVFFLWGGFSVSFSTLKFFFVLHFLLPWVIFFFVFIHLLFLHTTGSTSSLCYCGQIFKISFYPFFWFKDGFNVLLFFFFFFFIFSFPFSLGDPEMFVEADPLVSPVHIVPEWYFLFAYAILRSVPNKVLGVFFLLFSVFIFFLFCFFTNYLTVLDRFARVFLFHFIFSSLVLSWLGQCLVEPPFFLLGGAYTAFYFCFLLLYWFNYSASRFLFLYLL